MLEELIIRALTDTKPTEPTDGLFLFGQTEDNQTSVFATAKLLIETNQVPRVMFLNTPPMSGYPGFEAWHTQLQQLGIPAGKLEGIPVPPGTNKLHTLKEATAMVHHARSKGYRRIFVAASPFQQPRAFMAAVTAVHRFYPELHLYSQPGQPQPWSEEARHSQGEVEATRVELIAGEIERIHKYQGIGDLNSIEQVLAYLNTRDKGI